MLAVVMVSQLWSAATGQPNLFDHSESDAAMSSAPGVPSVCTLVLFTLASAGGLAWMLAQYRATQIIGRLLILGGAVPVVGYLAGFAPMYCYIEGRSSAMAIHTAVLFVLLGLSVGWGATRDTRQTPPSPKEDQS